MQHIKRIILTYKFKDIKLIFKEGTGDVKPREVLVEVVENGKTLNKSLAFIEKLPLGIYLSDINKWQDGFMTNEELKKVFK